MSGTYFIKRAREIRKFLVAVVQRQLRNVIEERDLLFWYCFFASLPSPPSFLKFADVVIEKSCYYGKVTVTFFLSIEEGTRMKEGLPLPGGAL